MSGHSVSIDAHTADRPATGIQTLAEALRRAEGVTHKGYTFLAGDGVTESRYSFDDVAREAKKRGRHLQAMGLEKGDRVGLVIPEPEDFVLAFLGAMSVGVIPVPMYPPLALGKLDSYVDSAARILKTARARMVLTTKKVSTILWSLLDKVEGLEDIVLVEQLREETSFAGRPVEIAPSDTCFLQFTSGSTADPKGVVVTHKNLVANANAIMYEGLESHPDRDVGVTWLPLYHDMGLIGFVVSPLVAQVAVVFIPTMTFVKRPTVWMDAMAKYRGTLSFAPNFAFALAAKYASRQIKDGFDLSCVKLIGCGAEPISAATLNRFLDAFAPAGMKRSAVMPAYGMAEATLAMSFDSIEEPFRTERIDREAYENDNRAEPYTGGDASRALEIVDCGRPFRSHELAIMSDDGRLLPDRSVGEIVFRGPSVTAGYFENRAATEEAFKDGWLHTGDLGFIIDGRVFISGRKKDLIILNGRNYHPQAIEWEIERVEGIRKGNVVAFAVRGEDSEKLVVVAETRRTDFDKLTEEVRAQVKNALNLAVADIILVPAGALPKTSSGKLQRRKTKSEYETGCLGRNGSRGFADTGASTKATVARHVTRSVLAKIRHRVRRFSTPITAAFGWGSNSADKSART